MTMTQSDQNLPNTDSPDKPSRRRIIQGLAAPMVLTVAPGAALAQGSLGLCLQRANTEATSAVNPAAAITTSTDKWLRIQRPLTRLKIDGRSLGNRKFFVGLNNRYWQLIPQSGGRYSAQITDYTDGGFGVEKVPVSSGINTIFAIVYIDETGTVKGLALENNGGLISTQSCYTSIVPSGTLRV